MQEGSHPHWVLAGDQKHSGHRLSEEGEKDRFALEGGEEEREGLEGVCGEGGEESVPWIRGRELARSDSGRMGGRTQ